MKYVFPKWSSARICIPASSGFVGLSGAVGKLMGQGLLRPHLAGEADVKSNPVCARDVSVLTTWAARVPGVELVTSTTP